MLRKKWSFSERKKFSLEAGRSKKFVPANPGRYAAAAPKAGFSEKSYENFQKKT